MPSMMAHPKAFFLSLFVHAVLISSVVYFLFQKEDTCSETCHVIVLKSIVHKANQPAVQKHTPVLKPQTKPKVKHLSKVKKPQKKKEPVIEKVIEPTKIVVTKTETEEVFEEVVEVKEVESVAVVVPSQTLEVIEEKPAVLATVSPEQKYVEAHLSEIQALLAENLYYPRMARKRGIEGKVLVSFCILKSGEVDNIKVLETSRDILGRAAIKTIKDLSGLFPKPSAPLTLHVPIRYSLQ